MGINKHNALNSLKKWKNGFLSVVYPSLCEICDRDLTEDRNFICRYCSADFDFTHYEKFESIPVHEVFWGRVNIEEGYSMLFYRQNSTTQKILHRIKYQNGHLLAVAMGEILGKKIKMVKGFDSLDAIVPIPIHSKKEFIRGYNQSLKICEGINATTKTPIVELLKRKEHHESQTKKDRFDRWDNVADIFSCSNKKVGSLNHVAIIDDVLTTGATMEAAIRTLKYKNPELKVSVITLAITRSV